MGISILAWLSSRDLYICPRRSRGLIWVIIPRPILGLGMITRSIQKCPCINLYVMSIGLTRNVVTCGGLIITPYRLTKYVKILLQYSPYIVVLCHFVISSTKFYFSLLFLCSVHSSLHLIRTSWSAKFITRCPINHVMSKLYYDEDKFYRFFYFYAPYND